MEQIAHRIAYLDGDLPLGNPDERVRDGDAEDEAAQEGWTKPHRANVDSLDRRALSDLGFDTNALQFFSGQAGLQFWLLPAQPDATVTPIIAFRGTASVMDLAEDVNGVGIGMGQFTMNQAVIEAAVRRIARGRGAVATGHSLGGALAQITACFYPDAIVSVVTFQSPAIRRDLVDRLRALPPDQRPTAKHHRVGGDLVDDAGEAFVPGAVTLHGEGGVDPVTAHTSFPILSQQQREEDKGAGWVPDFARGKTHPGIGSTAQSGTTDDPSFGRPLAGTGLAEASRRNPIAAGATLLGGLGATGGPLLSGLGTLAGGVGGAYLANKVKPDEVYARIWLKVLEHAEAGDYDFVQLKWQAIEEPCRSAGYKEHVHPMVLNLIQMYPEYPASQHVAEHQPEALRDVASFTTAVLARVPSLSPAAIARLRMLFPRYKR